jgi:NADH dehydrogenase
VQNILIVGGGFAGVWSALAAVATRARLGGGPSDVRITLVNRDPYLTIRPRLYEADPAGLRVPLDEIFGDDVERVVGDVGEIDTRARRVAMRGPHGSRWLPYDRLILTAGSRLHRPDVPGAATHAHGVDTWAEAVALDRHLAALPAGAPRPGRFTAVVVGGGFTGLEVATQLVARLRDLARPIGAEREVRIVLVERRDVVGADLEAAARAVIEQALDELGIERRLGATVAAVGTDGVRVADRAGSGGGEWIAASTTVWTGGLRASALAAQLGGECDDLGRTIVDEYLRVRGVEGVLAAGDAARAFADGEHVAPMSCQLAIPMGETAGRNAVAELLGAPTALAAFSWPQYVTCLDLGDRGALFTEGWDRRVRLTGFWAKVLKQTINGRLIYPPRASGRPTRGGLTPGRSTPRRAPSRRERVP